MSGLAYILIGILITLIFIKRNEIGKHIDTELKKKHEFDKIQGFIIWMFSNPVYVVFFIVMFIYIAIKLS